jgi:hypothetical protein
MLSVNDGWDDLDEDENDLEAQEQEEEYERQEEERARSRLVSAARNPPTSSSRGSKATSTVGPKLVAGEMLGSCLQIKEPYGYLC